MESSKVEPNVATCSLCGEKFQGATQEELLTHLVLNHSGELLLWEIRRLVSRRDLLDRMQTLGAKAAQALFKR